MTVVSRKTFLIFVRKFVAAGIVAVYTVTSIVPACAQSVLDLPSPGVRVSLSPEFAPAILKGIKVYPANPFRFDFILDKGDSSLTDEIIKEESARLIRYFLASLTVPEIDLWVNLSPYEKDRIIPDQFGKTEMGRDLLAEDYLLKQITASLMYPEDEMGKKFWKRVYEEAAKRFNTTDISVNTFNKVWIVPEKAVVYENAEAGTAYIVESRLKVMLEEDYVAMSHQKDMSVSSAAAGDATDVNQLGSRIVRELIIPELEKEVNEGRHFAKLRQVYHSLILAVWYKKKIKDSILAQIYVDRNKITGVNINDYQEKQKIYERYLQAFKKGVYNYIKEDYDPVTHEAIPRKYFSGGVQLKFDFSVGGPSSGPGSTNFEITSDPNVIEPDLTEGEGHLVVAAGANVSADNSAQLELSFEDRAVVTVEPTGSNQAIQEAERLLAAGQTAEAQAAIMPVFPEEAKPYFDQRTTLTLVDGTSLRAEVSDLILLAKMGLVGINDLSRVTDQPASLIPLRRFANQLVAMGEFAEDYFEAIQDIAWRRNTYPPAYDIVAVSESLLSNEQVVDFLVQLAQLFKGIRSEKMTDGSERRNITFFRFLAIAKGAEYEKADAPGIQFILDHAPDILALGAAGVEYLVEYANSFNSRFNERYGETRSYENVLLTEKTLEELKSFQGNADQIRNHLILLGQSMEAPAVLRDESAMERYRGLSPIRQAELAGYLRNLIYYRQTLEAEELRAIFSRGVLDVYEQYGTEVNSWLKLIVESPSQVVLYSDPEFVARFRRLSALGLGESYAAAIGRLNDATNVLGNEEFVGIVEAMAGRDFETARQYLNLAGDAREYVVSTETLGTRYVPTGQLHLAGIMQPEFIAAFATMKTEVRKELVNQLRGLGFPHRDRYFRKEAMEVMAVIRRAVDVHTIKARMGEDDFYQLVVNDNARRSFISALTAPMTDQTTLLKQARLAMFQDGRSMGLLERINQADELTRGFKEDLMEAISTRAEFAQYLNEGDNFDFVVMLAARSNQLASAYVHILSAWPQTDLTHFRRTYETILNTEEIDLLTELMELLQRNPSLIGQVDMEKLKTLYTASGYIGQKFIRHAVLHPEILSSQELYDQLMAFAGEDEALGIFRSPENRIDYTREGQRGRSQGVFMWEEEANSLPVGNQLADFLILVSHRVPDLTAFSAILPLLRNINPNILTILGHSFQVYDAVAQRRLDIPWGDNRLMQEPLLKALAEIESLSMAKFILQTLANYLRTNRSEDFDALMAILSDSEDMSRINKVSAQRLQWIGEWKRYAQGKGEWLTVLGIEQFTSVEALRRLLTGSLTDEVLEQLLVHPAKATGQEKAITDSEDQLLRQLFSEPFIGNLEQAQEMFGPNVAKNMIILGRLGPVSFEKTFLDPNYLENLRKNVVLVFGEDYAERFNEAVNSPLLELLNQPSENLASYMAIFRELIGQDVLDAFLSQGNYTVLTKWVKLFDAIGFESERMSLFKKQVTALPVEVRTGYLSSLSSFTRSPVLPRIVELDAAVLGPWQGHLKAFEEVLTFFNHMTAYGWDVQTASDMAVAVLKSGQRFYIYELRSFSGLVTAQERLRRKAADLVKVQADSPNREAQERLSALLRTKVDDIELTTVLSWRDDPTLKTTLEQLPLSPEEKRFISETIEILLLNRLLHIMLSNSISPEGINNKRLMAIVNTLHSVSEIVSRYGDGGAASEVLVITGQSVMKVNDVLRAEFDNQRTPDAIDQIYKDFMTELLKQITGLQAIPPEILSNAQIVGKILTIANLYYTLSRHNGATLHNREIIRAKMKDLLVVYINSGGDQKKVREAILAFPENVEEINRLVEKKGYKIELWKEGIEVEDEVIPVSLTEGIELAQDNINQAFHEIVEIVQGLGDQVPEDEQQAKTLQDAIRNVERIKMRMGGGISDVYLTMIERVLSNIKHIETAAQEVKVAKTTKVKIVLGKNFFDEATSGLGVPGCYAPNGIHAERPPSHALEGNAFMAMMYDQETGGQIANAVVVLTDDGALVFGQYSNRSDLNLHGAWAKAWQKLAQFVPAVILPQRDSLNIIAGRPYLEQRPSGAVVETITVAQRQTLFKEMYYDFGSKDETGSWTYSGTNPIIIRADPSDQPAVEQTVETEPVPVADQPGPQQVDNRVNALEKVDRGIIVQELFGLGLDIELKPVISQLDQIILTLSDAEINVLIDGDLLRSRRTRSQNASPEDKGKLKEKLRDLVLRHRLPKAFDSLEQEVERKVAAGEPLSEGIVRNLLQDILVEGAKLNLTQVKSATGQEVRQSRQADLPADIKIQLHTLLNPLKDETFLGEEQEPADLAEVLFGKFIPDETQITVVGELTLEAGVVTIDLGSAQKQLDFVDQDRMAGQRGILQFQLYHRNGELRIEVVDMISKDPQGSRRLYAAFENIAQETADYLNKTVSMEAETAVFSTRTSLSDGHFEASPRSRNLAQRYGWTQIKHIQSQIKAEWIERVQPLLSRLGIPFEDIQTKDIDQSHFRYYEKGIAPAPVERFADHVGDRDSERLEEQTREARSEEALAPGGIDFNPDQLNLHIHNQGQGIEMTIDPVMLEQLKNAPGLTPFIINVQPMTNLFLFLGLRADHEQNTL